MALDEPKSDDRVIERGQYQILLDPQIVGVLEQTNGLTVDYVDEAHQKGYLIRLNQANASCEDHAGGCSSCG